LSHGNRNPAISGNNKRALKVLNKEMGIVDTVRFINQFTTGYGDYTQDREQLFKDMTLDDIISAVKKK
jgi:hypothetical protein